MLSDDLMVSGGVGMDDSIMATSSIPINTEAAIQRESVAKRYAAFFQSTLHHNNGYFMQFFVCEVNRYVAF